MLRFLFALPLLIGAVFLIGAAGGLDVFSPLDWSLVAEKWSLPPTSDNVRCLTLLIGAVSGLLALVRLLNPVTLRPRSA